MQMWYLPHTTALGSWLGEALRTVRTMPSAALRIDAASIATTANVASNRPSGLAMWGGFHQFEAEFGGGGGGLSASCLRSGVQQIRLVRAWAVGGGLVWWVCSNPRCTQEACANLPAIGLAFTSGPNCTHKMPGHLFSASYQRKAQARSHEGCT